MSDVLLRLEKKSEHNMKWTKGYKRKTYTFREVPSAIQECLTLTNRDRHTSTRYFCAAHWNKQAKAKYWGKCQLHDLLFCLLPSRFRSWVGIKMFVSSFFAPNGLRRVQAIVLIILILVTFTKRCVVHKQIFYCLIQWQVEIICGQKKIESDFSRKKRADSLNASWVPDWVLLLI